MQKNNQQRVLVARRVDGELIAVNFDNVFVVEITAPKYRRQLFIRTVQPERKTKQNYCNVSCAHHGRAADPVSRTWFSAAAVSWSCRRADRIYQCETWRHDPYRNGQFPVFATFTACTTESRASRESDARIENKQKNANDPEFGINNRDAIITDCSRKKTLNNEER